MASAELEIQQGKRFAFGRNWASFLETLDDSRIEIATQSLKDLVPVPDWTGVSFLDLGSGSGLFSLAARRLGAKVHSVDFDPESVACAEELKRRFFPGDADWMIEQGSALDESFLKSLVPFDVVYSWGVLHHTGAMHRSMELAGNCVAPGGFLSIALYHDQGAISRGWKAVKQVYCSGAAGRAIVSAIFIPYFALRTIGVSLIRRRNEFAAYRRHRGMSITHDWIDWLGGLPFETARPEEVFNFYRRRGFDLVSLKTTRRLGCNEFVFQRQKASCEKMPVR